MRKLWQSLRARLRPPTLIELLTVIAILSVLVAPLIPPVKWGSSGEVDLNVRVFVFDAESAQPIAGARVGIKRFPPVHTSQALAEHRQRFPVYADDIAENSQGVTDADGTVTIVHRFRKDANYRNPKGFAHVSPEWVFVETPGYTGVAMPVRHESVPIPSLRETGVVPVTIGLLRTK